MNGSTGLKEQLIAQYREDEGSLPGRDVPWLSRLREESLAAFERLGLPTPRQEEWKYTSVAPIERLGPRVVARGLAGSVWLPQWPGYAAAFVNGGFKKDQSRLDGLPAGVSVTDLGEALDQEPDLVKPFLGRLAAGESNGFAALNTAYCRDGVVVRVRPGVHLDRPLLLVYNTAVPAQGFSTVPRNLIIAGAGSEFTIVEIYRGEGTDGYLTNAVTEIHVEAGAGVEHCKLQCESAAAFHVATVQVHQAAGSRFTSRNFSVGGRLTRNDINTVLNAPGADCTLEGLYLTDGRQHVDNHTFIDHAVPGCSSREVYKGVLDGRSRAVFNGRILVRQDAQQTDARQSNHNLLMSQDAEIDTKPQLEIYADDVRCAHGATVGCLDADALFYLRSRGVDERAARGMLTYAFVRELIDRVPAAALRRGLEGQVMQSLPGVTPALHEFPEVRP